MSDFFTSLEKIARNIDKMERIKAKEKYQNALVAIEKDNIKYNLQLNKNLSNLTNPILFYDFMSTSNEFNDFINEYYKKQKKEIIKKEFKKEKPLSLSGYLKNKIPKQSIVKELFNNSLKHERLQQKEMYTQEYYNKYLKDFENESIKNETDFKNKLEKENQDILDHNNDLEERKKSFYSGNSTEIEAILDKLFCNVVFKFDEETYRINKKFSYDSKNRILSIDLCFFSPSVFLKIPKSRKYIKKDNNYKYTYLSESEVNNYYETYLLGTTLFIIYRINNFFDKYIDSFFVNSFINDINPNSGKNDKILVLSSNIEHTSLNSININNINAKEYFKSINSKISKNMKKLISVQSFTPNHQKNYEKYSIENINFNIDGFEFEKLSKDLLLLNGFNQVEVTKASGDYGADVIAFKDDIKYAIQCKKFSSKVGVSAIQEVIASKSIYNCHVAAVLTNNYFTPNAIKLANENNVLLWDRDRLIIMLKEYNQKKNSINNSPTVIQSESETVNASDSITE